MERKTQEKGQIGEGGMKQGIEKQEKAAANSERSGMKCLGGGQGRRKLKGHVCSNGRKGG